MHDSPFTADRCTARPLLGVGVVALAGLLTGCAGRDLQPSWAKSKLGMEEISVTDVQGPEERRLQQVAYERAAREHAEFRGSPLADQFRQLESAQLLYEQGKYAEAEKSFDRIAKNSQGPWWNRSKTGIFARRGEYGDSAANSPIEEDALFWRGQSQFKQGHLADAESSYALLLKNYPSTRHLDTVSRQLFRIAREWLGFPDQSDEEIVRVAYGENAKPTVEQRRRQGGWFPNVSDKTRPAFDAEGRALAALRLIWLHDAAGPIADDALMMAANHYVRQGNHIDAAQHYRLLREQFPDSPHLKDALLLGSHVTLASYNGPGYDPSPLEDAKEMSLLALQFPDLSDAERQRIQTELDRMAEAEVEPLWKEVEFYLAKRQGESVLLQCNYIINKHPNSKFARMAAGLKQEMESKGRVPPNWPAVGPQRGPMAAVPRQSPQAGAANGVGVDVTGPASGPESAAGDGRSFFGRLLRRADEPPQLQPVQEEYAPGAASYDPESELPAASAQPGTTTYEGLFDDPQPSSAGRAHVNW
jgi:outer membrane protein assembly factor BamD (BamD/ComL family)